MCHRTAVCVLILLYVCPHTAMYYIYVLILLSMCPHTATHVSSFCYILVLIAGHFFFHVLQASSSLQLLMSVVGLGCSNGLFRAGANCLVLRIHGPKVCAFLSLSLSLSLSRLSLSLSLSTAFFLHIPPLFSWQASFNILQYLRRLFGMRTTTSASRPPLII